MAYRSCFPPNTRTHIPRVCARWHDLPGPRTFLSRTILFNRFESLDFLAVGKVVDRAVLLGSETVLALLNIVCLMLSPHLPEIDRQCKRDSV